VLAELSPDLVDFIVRCSVLPEDSVALVERWITQLPQDWMSPPEVAGIQAMCGWARWNFVQSLHHLESACAGFRETGNQAQFLRYFAMLPRAYNAVGRLQDAEQILWMARDLALLEGDLATAEIALLEAETLQQSWPMLLFIGDVRITLAWLRIQQGRPEQAWQIFEPLLQRSLSEDGLGLLLTSPAFAVDPLLALIPATLRNDVQPLLDTAACARSAGAVGTRA